MGHRLAGWGLSEHGRTPRACSSQSSNWSVEPVGSSGVGTDAPEENRRRCQLCGVAADPSAASARPSPLDPLPEAGGGVDASRGAGVFVVCMSATVSVDRFDGCGCRGRNCGRGCDGDGCDGGGGCGGVSCGCGDPSADGAGAAHGTSGVDGNGSGESIRSGSKHWPHASPLPLSSAVSAMAAASMAAATTALAAAVVTGGGSGASARAVGRSCRYVAYTYSYARRSLMRARNQRHERRCLPCATSHRTVEIAYRHQAPGASSGRTAGRNDRRACTASGHAARLTRPAICENCSAVTRAHTSLTRAVPSRWSTGGMSGMSVCGHSMRSAAFAFAVHGSTRGTVAAVAAAAADGLTEGAADANAAVAAAAVAADADAAGSDVGQAATPSARGKP